MGYSQAQKEKTHKRIVAIASKRFREKGLAGFGIAELMKEAGLIRTIRKDVKILGRGELTKSLTVRAHAFSAGAVRAVEAAGGSVETIPAPWGEGRPAARGNALTNR